MSFIYFEWSICKIQYAEKSKTPFHIRLNNQPTNIFTHPTIISIIRMENSQ